MRKTTSILTAVLLISLSNLFSQDAKKEIPELVIFKAGKCNSCHSVEKAGLMKKENQKAPDLSIMTDDIVDSEILTKFIKKEVKVKDKKHLLKFNGSDEDLKILADWLMSLKNEVSKQDSSDNVQRDSAKARSGSSLEK